MFCAPISTRATSRTCDDRAVRIGAQDDVAELGRRRQAPLRLQIDLELLVVLDRPRADASDRGLNILRLDGGDDVGGREVEADQPLTSNQMRIEYLSRPNSEAWPTPGVRDSSSSTLIVA